jgi:hypothetical protein
VDCLPAARRRAVLFTAATVMAAGAAGRAQAAPSARIQAPIMPDASLADQSPMIQAAIDDAARGEGGSVALGPGEFRCRSPIVIDPTKISLVGEHARLDFSGAGPALSAALVVSPSGQSTQYGHATQWIEGLGITGPGHGAAILFSAGIASFSSRISLRNLDISGFEDGLLFADRAYLIQVYSTSIRGCANAVHAPANLQDAGENIAFFGCTLSAGAVRCARRWRVEFFRRVDDGFGQ